MTYKNIGISLIASTVIGLGLVGCGGSSSGGSSDSNTTLSGIAIDGYLEKALVCLDRNANNDCDGDEPISITAEDGSFTLNGVSQEDKENYAVLVKAILGQTKDSDDNGLTIKNEFFLKAPASKADVVSPLTTIVQNKLESDPLLTVDEAIYNVKKTLKLTGTVNIMNDYIKAKDDIDDENKDTYKTLHKVAQVITDTLGTSLKESNISIDSPDLADAGMVLIEKIDSKLLTILKEASKDDFDIDTYVAANKETVSSDEISEVKIKKEKITLISENTQKVSDSKNLETALKGDGLINYSFGKDTSANDFYLYTYKEIYKNDKFSHENANYKFDGNTFIKEAPYINNNDYFYSSIETYYVSTNQGWKKEERTYTNTNNSYEDNYTYTFNDDGSYNDTSIWGTYKITLYSTVNLKGQKIKDFVNTNFWDNSDITESSTKYYISENDVFTEDTYLYTTKIKKIIDENEFNLIITTESCYSNDSTKTEKSDMTCEDWSKNLYTYDNNNSYQTFTSINEFKDFYAKGTSNFYNTNTIYKSQFDANGTIYYFEINNNQELPLTGKINEVKKGTITVYEFANQEQYTWDYENENEENSWDNSSILTVVDGYLRPGYWEKSAYSWSGNYYNQKALDNIVKSLEIGIKEKGYTSVSIVQ